MKLFHTTPPDRAESIQANGFIDSQYDAFGGGATGAYFCTMPGHVRADGDVVLMIEMPDAEVERYPSDPCTGVATDWLIPAAVVNRYPILFV